MPNRPEGYFYLSRYNERMGNWQEAYTFADLGLRYAERTEPLPVNVEYPGKYALLFEKAVSGWWLGRDKESHDIFKDLLNNYPIAPEYRNGILSNLKKIKKFSEQEDVVNTMEPIVANYRKYFGKEANTIVDIGTRDGDDANWLKERLHATKVIAIDASPSAFELTKERYPWMEVHHVAVSDYEGETKFQQVISDDISEVGCSSIYADKVVNNERFKGKVNEITVPVTRMDSLVRENTTGLLDLVKVDVEGFTWEVLNGFGLRLRDVKMFHLETDHIKTQPNHKSPEEIAAFMEANDFFLVDKSYEWGPGIEDQIWINKDYVIYHKEVFN
jgi:FkbM family methyltransferase